MFELTKIIATNQPDINISVVSGNSYNTETAGIVHNEKGDISGNSKIAGEHLSTLGQQDLLGTSANF